MRCSDKRRLTTPSPPTGLEPTGTWWSALCSSLGSSREPRGRTGSCNTRRVIFSSLFQSFSDLSLIFFSCILFDVMFIFTKRSEFCFLEKEGRSVHVTSKGRSEPADFLECTAVCQFSFFQNGYLCWQVSCSGINPLYAYGHVQRLLQLQEAEEVLVAFYGILAQVNSISEFLERTTYTTHFQGMTRNTFIGGESNVLIPLNERGRLIYLPPNSASNGFFLWLLRNLLIQDWNSDSDQMTDSLWLLFATPRHWMHHGNRIQITDAPTVYGNMSMSVHSQLHEGQVTVRVASPAKARPKQTLIRMRLPEGWTVTSASCNSQTLLVDQKDTVDVSAFTGNFTVVFYVKWTAEFPRTFQFKFSCSEQSGEIEQLSCWMEQPNISTLTLVSISDKATPNVMNSRQIRKNKEGLTRRCQNMYSKN